MLTPTPIQKTVSQKKRTVIPITTVNKRNRPTRIQGSTIRAPTYVILSDDDEDGVTHTPNTNYPSHPEVDGTASNQYNLPTASEVAAIIPSDGVPTQGRDVILQYKGGPLKRISELHPSYMALQYPLLFPYGEDGFRLDIPKNVPHGARSSNVTLKEFYTYRLQEREGEGNTLHKAGRLLQQYCVDAYACVEENNLRYVDDHQADLRAELYTGLRDRVVPDDASAEEIGKRVILLSTFVGSPRYMVQNYQDAMAICRWGGPPDLFITMTCNPNWPEIVERCNKTARGQKPHHRCDITDKVFKIKLDELMEDLKAGHFGEHKASLYTIEFQKRGLPHAHILLWLENKDKLVTPMDIDKHISAELPCPETEPLAYEAVISHMIHGPCGMRNLSSPCMTDGKCTKEYPKKWNDETSISKDGWPIYRRRNNGRSGSVLVRKQPVPVDNRDVVPHNKDLLIKYNAHINVEWCSQGMLVQYLFKYLNKGSDRATVVFSESSEGQQLSDYQMLAQNKNEISQFQDCRYISASEACWRLFGYDIHYRSIGVVRLSFHLQDEHNVFFSRGKPRKKVLDRPNIDKTQFTEWMVANSIYPEARTLTYAEFPSKFTWHDTKDVKAWKPRAGPQKVVGRIYAAPVNAGELFYLRMLLNVVKGPTCFDGIRTYEGKTYSTFKETCMARNMLGDDREWILSIKDAAFWKTGHQLRSFFVAILCFGEVSDCKRFWEQSYPYLSDDIVFLQRRRLSSSELTFTEEEILNYTLIEVENIMNGNNRSLKEFLGIPMPDVALSSRIGNRFILQESRYDVAVEKSHFEKLHAGLNHQQKEVFDSVLSAVKNKKGGVFFVYGNGGTGKTYLWNTLTACLRSKRQIVLAVASSGIASLLLPGGRTAHSRFKIPINADEYSTCNIKYNDDLAELIRIADLIIWDEAPLQHRFVFEAVNRTFQHIMTTSTFDASKSLFGGKVFVLGGDFRQVLPVITRGTRGQIVNASISKSKVVWDACKVYVLTINMRLRDSSLDSASVEKMKEFSDWLLAMGDGKLPAIALEGEDDNTWITIPDDLLIPVSEHPVKSIVESTYPALLENLNCHAYLQSRAILASTNDTVDEINSYMLDLLPGEKIVLQSADTICPTTTNLEEMQSMYPVEFLNTLKFSGIPKHEIHLKVGAPIMLVRNISLKDGLCNGTRLIVKRLTKRTIEAEVVTGPSVGEHVYIGRIVMTPSESKWPFQMKRRQFPIKVCFAMTINKSQGQTFNNVGVYLKKPVFSHGQLYVAASRVTSRAGLMFYIDNDDDCQNNMTKNVVYREIFSDLL